MKVVQRPHVIDLPIASIPDIIKFYVTFNLLTLFGLIWLELVNIDLLFSLFFFLVIDRVFNAVLVFLEAFLARLVSHVVCRLFHLSAFAIKGKLLQVFFHNSICYKALSYFENQNLLFLLIVNPF